MNLTKHHAEHLVPMIHIENIPHLLQFGITQASSSNANLDYITIGDGSLISKRNETRIPNGRWLGEYIPFYFGTRMPKRRF